RNVRGSSPSTSVVPLSNQVTTLNHKRFKRFKMFSDGHLGPGEAPSFAPTVSERRPLPDANRVIWLDNFWPPARRKQWKSNRSAGSQPSSLAESPAGSPSSS